MIKKILVATDGSDHADKAVTLAGEIAARHEADLRLLYVRPSGPVPKALCEMLEVEYQTGSRDDRASPSEEALGRKIGELVLDRAEQAARDLGARSITRSLDDGDPAERIVDHAKRDDANLVVMGCRGLGALGGLLMGSVSHKVAQLSPCSCITVK